MHSEKFTVDRTENGIVVLIGNETENIIEIPTEKFDSAVCDGDVVYLSFDSDGNVSEIKKDAQQTDIARSKMKKKLKSLFDN